MNDSHGLSKESWNLFVKEQEQTRKQRLARLMNPRKITTPGLEEFLTSQKTLRQRKLSDLMKPPNINELTPEEKSHLEKTKHLYSLDRNLNRLNSRNQLYRKEHNQMKYHLKSHNNTGPSTYEKNLQSWEDLAKGGVYKSSRTLKNNHKRSLKNNSKRLLNKGE
jgi:hypothetical protein